MGVVDFCPNCGAKVVENAKFCGNCGKQLPNMEAQAVAPAPVESAHPMETQHPQPMKTPDGHHRLPPNMPPVPPRGNWVPDEGFEANFLKQEGRLNRWRYFKRTLLIGLLDAILCAVVGAIFDFSEWPEALASLVAIPAYYGLDVRRLHDMGKGSSIAQWIMGLTVITSLIPPFMAPTPVLEPEYGYVDPRYLAMLVVLMVLQLYILFCPGNHGDNKYGPNPLY